MAVGHGVHGTHKNYIIFSSYLPSRSHGLAELAISEDLD